MPSTEIPSPELADALGVVGGLEQVQLPVDEVVDALEALAHADRPGPRHAGDAELVLDLVEQLERGSALAVELVDEGDDRRVAHATDPDQLLGPRLDALGPIDDHERRVDGREHAIGVLAEVGVARRVEQVDVGEVIDPRRRGDAWDRVLEAHDRGRDRDPALLLHLHPVRHGVARGLARAHGPRHLDRPAEQQELLRQRGLAGVGVTDDRKGSPTANLGLGLLVGLAHGGREDGRAERARPVAPSLDPARAAEITARTRTRR